MRATCPPSPRNFITLSIFSEAYKWWSSSLKQHIHALRLSLSLVVLAPLPSNQGVLNLLPRKPTGRHFSCLSGPLFALCSMLHNVSTIVYTTLLSCCCRTVILPSDIHMFLFVETTTISSCVTLPCEWPRWNSREVGTLFCLASHHLFEFIVTHFVSQQVKMHSFRLTCSSYHPSS